MYQTLQLLKNSYSFLGREKEEGLETILKELFLKKIHWRKVKEKFKDLSCFSRIIEPIMGRTILHLAILDQEIDLVKMLKDDPFLKSRKDHAGLSPTDLARLLNDPKILKILGANNENEKKIDVPVVYNFEYLSSPYFETKKGLDDVFALVSKAKREDRIPSEKVWMGVYYDQDLQERAPPPVEIRFIDHEVGYGVFALNEIPACAFVGEYAGIIKQKSPKELENKLYCLKYPTWGGKKNYTIDAENKGNFTRFLNHSFRPNLGLQSIYWKGIPRMVFISIGKIQKGDQLTFDYGLNYWKKLGKTPKDF